MSARAAAIYAFTPQGLEIGIRLASSLDGRLFAPLSLRDGYQKLQASGAAQMPFAAGQSEGRSGDGLSFGVEDGGKGPGEAAEPAAEMFDCDVHVGFGTQGNEDSGIDWFSSLSGLVAKTFFQHDLHIFVGATGIAVRSIAPLLCSKDTDPAVLVVDQKARFVISLLSGHLGGANAWAAVVAELLGATPVITTATDMEALPAMDLLAREKGLALSDLAAMEGFKTVSAALLAGRLVHLYDPDDWLGLCNSPFFVPADSPEEAAGPILSGQKEAGACVIVTERDPVLWGLTAQNSVAEEREEQSSSFSGTPLVLHPPALFIGIGCRLGITAAAILRALHEAYTKAGLSLAASVAFASVDAKEQEAGLQEAAEQLGLPLYFYGTDILGALPVTKPSSNVMERFGIPGVCEPAALAAALGLKECSCLLPKGQVGAHMPPPFGPPVVRRALPDAVQTEDKGMTEDAAGPKGRRAEGVFSQGVYAADLLLPKYALNGVTVAIAMRRKA